MKVLDLFCGLGGWSKPWIEAGHECTGIDLYDFRYPARFIKADLMDWKPDQKYDVILASPPCGEFSIIKQISPKHIWSERKGLLLVWRAFDLIQQIKPKWWIVENVKGLAKFLPPANQVIRYGKAKSSKEAHLWTNIPKLGFFTEQIEYKVDWTAPGWKQLKNPNRGEIPQALAKAVLGVCNN